METNLIITGVLWMVMSIFFSAFIIWFDRKKFATPKLGFYYLLLFYMAGILMLTISVGS